tara:strand:- start:1193 stop:2719 length:1527 start_codon:yes stop_codon:yes gene_type:complete
MPYTDATLLPLQTRTDSKADTGISTVKEIPLTFSKTKSVSYGTSDRIYSGSTTVSDSAESAPLPKKIDVTNTGRVPVTIMVGYETYSDETTESGATRYHHIMLKPNERYSPPIMSVISTENATTQFDGTAVSNQAPNSNMYTDSTADVDHATSATIGSDATHTTLNLENGHSIFFREKDIIRIENEICEVTALGTGADLANSTLTIIRGTHGSTAATHADDVAVRFPFFNAYHDFDKFSVAQTDADGRFKCTNMFGFGRASSGRQGIVAGSFAMKFYNAGYQELGMTGVTASTHSGLAASTEYKFNITVDGGSTFANLTFTTDSSNLAFGGQNGVVQVIQQALNVQYYTSGNLFEKKVHVDIVGGDIRFSSGSHLSTSAIALAAPSSGTTPFGVGRIPAIGNVDAAVAARLPDDVSYDRVTYEQTPNDVFCYDDGEGNIIGNGCEGTINYWTGAIDIVNAPPNAEWVYSVSYNSAFSGKLVTGENAIVSILANCPSQKRSAKVKLDIY